MRMIEQSSRTMESSEGREPRESAGGLSRRTVLAGATLAAGTVAGAAPALADTVTPPDYGAPLVELHFPAGLLSLEQKAAMIKGVSDVMLSVVKVPADQARKLWVQIFETAEGGWGFDGRVLVLHPK
jgi:phenylpyruvate tautomerase PptA (4-oxalocrotonate tautomerase family)